MKLGAQQCRFGGVQAEGDDDGRRTLSGTVELDDEGGVENGDFDAQTEVAS